MARKKSELVSQAVVKMVPRLGLSGFSGFDFMLDRSDKAYLLEMNMQPTQIARLSFDSSTDVIGALSEWLLGRKTTAPIPSCSPSQAIALFPRVSVAPSLLHSSARLAHLCPGGGRRKTAGRRSAAVVVAGTESAIDLAAILDAQHVMVDCQSTLAEMRTRRRPSPRSACHAWAEKKLHCSVTESTEIRALSAIELRFVDAQRVCPNG